MELRVLRYFIAVVDERNISQAAEKLHVSQPTISRQLRELENELGVTLFDRGSRAISLTTAGEYFAGQARKIITLADKSVMNVQRTEALRGSIYIGCAEIPMMTTVARAIHQLGVLAPDVRVDVYSTHAQVVLNRMDAGIFDFGLVVAPTDKHDYNFLNLPGTAAWGALVRQDSPLAQKAVLTRDDLLDQRVITPQQPTSLGILTDWLGNNDRTLNIVATYNLLYNAALMASADVGIVLGLDGILNPANSQLRFIPLAPRLESSASLLWPNNQLLSPAANAFLTCLRAVLAERT